MDSPVSYVLQLYMVAEILLLDNGLALLHTIYF